MPDSDDPFKPSDATILRPRPGGGRRGDVGTQVRSAQPAAPAEPIGQSRQELIGTGLNALVQAATPLLLLSGHVRGTLAAPDVPPLLYPLGPRFYVQIVSFHADERGLLAALAGPEERVFWLPFPNGTPASGREFSGSRGPALQPRP